MKINTHFQQLPDNYLFKEIALRVKAYKDAHPEAKILRLGVGDVTRPLPLPIVDAMHRAVEELAHTETFRGYGPEEGYTWLKQAIINNDFKPRGIELTTDEVFISEGAGSDLGNLSDLFDKANKVAILDPSYPAYVDASIMAGREIEFRTIMADIHAACLKYGTEEDGYINYVKGANIAGFMKVANAMVEQGLV